MSDDCGRAPISRRSGFTPFAQRHVLARIQAAAFLARAAHNLLLGAYYRLDGGLAAFVGNGPIAKTGVPMFEFSGDHPSIDLTCFLTGKIDPRDLAHALPHEVRAAIFVLI